MSALYSIERSVRELLLRYFEDEEDASGLVHRYSSLEKVVEDLKASAFDWRGPLALAIHTQELIRLYLSILDLIQEDRINRRHDQQIGKSKFNRGQRVMAQVRQGWERELQLAKGAKEHLVKLSANALEFNLYDLTRDSGRTNSNDAEACIPLTQVALGLVYLITGRHSDAKAMLTKAASSQTAEWPGSAAKILTTDVAPYYGKITGDYQTAIFLMNGDAESSFRQGSAGDPILDHVVKGEQSYSRNEPDYVRIEYANAVEGCWKYFFLNPILEYMARCGINELPVYCRFPTKPNPDPHPRKLQLDRDNLEMKSVDQLRDWGRALVLLATASQKDLNRPLMMELGNVIKRIWGKRETSALQVLGGSLERVADYHSAAGLEDHSGLRDLILGKGEPSVLSQIARTFPLRTESHT